MEDVFLCSVFLIMCQVTLTTTTLHVTFAVSGTTVKMVPTSLDLTALGQHYVVLSQAVNLEGHNEGFCWPHHYAAATTTSVSDAFSGICQSGLGSF